jgi:molybdate transport system substrate-binding protein
VELVLTLASEIIPVDGIDFAGLLPPELQNYVMIGAGVSAQSSNREAGQALIRFLSSAAVDPALKANGMERH